MLRKIRDAVYMSLIIAMVLFFVYDARREIYNSLLVIGLFALGFKIEESYCNYKDRFKK